MTVVDYTKRWLHKFRTMHPVVPALENRTIAGHAMVFEDGLDFCQKGLQYLRAHKADRHLHTRLPVDAADLAAAWSDVQTIQFLTTSIENMLVLLAKTYRQLKHGKPIEIPGRGRFWWRDAKLTERKKMHGIIEGVVEDFGEFDDQ